MDELKPCPFCGKQVELIYWDEEHQNEKKWEPCDEEEGVIFPIVRCYECDATFVFDTPYGTGKSVIEAWNRRI